MRNKPFIFLVLVLLSPLLAFADYTIETTSTSVQRNGYGYDNTYSALATPFTTTGAGTIEDITVALKKSGSPDGNTVVEIQGNNSGQPNGTALASLSIANSSLTTSCADYSGTLSSVVSLSASTKYWVVLYRSNSNSTGNYMFNCGLSVAGAGNDQSGTIAFSWSDLGDSLGRFEALVTEGVIPPTPTTTTPMSIDAFGITVGLAWLGAIATFFGFIWLLRQHK